MSDRCWIDVEFRASDRAEVCAVLSKAVGWDADELFEADDGIISASVSEANYAWYSDLLVLAKTGVPFTVLYRAAR